MTEEEHKQLLSLLEKLEPGFYPIELFWQFARLMTVSTVVFVPMFKDEKGVYVWLIPREQTDKFWPGQFHVPGCVVRPTDSVEDVAQRITQQEMRGARISKPTYVTTEIRKTERGNESVSVYYVELKGRPIFGELYQSNDLPEDSIQVDNRFIQQAVKAYKNSL